MSLLRCAGLFLMTTILMAGEMHVRLADRFIDQKHVVLPDEVFEGVGFVLRPDTLSTLRSHQPARITFPLAGQEHEFTLEYLRERDLTTTWRGVNAQLGAQIVLTVSDRSLFATCYAGADKFLLAPADEPGLFFSYRLDTSKQIPMMGCTADPTSQVLELAPHEAYDLKAARACDASAQIDVMILYTEGLAARLGGNLEARVQHLVDLTNTAYTNSMVDMELRLVHSDVVTYSDDTDIGDALTEFTNNGGIFSDVEALRDQYGADQVTLLRNLRPQGGLITCGIAWLVRSSGTQGGRSAYAVVDDHFSQCFDLAYAHEVGHNLGLAHDRATQDEFDGSGGKYSYSNGYQEIGGNFVTVMGYDFTGICPCGYIPNFSNPRVMVNGLATGVEESESTSADNAKTLDDTRNVMARYRGTLKGSTLGNLYYLPEIQLQDGRNTFIGIVNSSTSSAAVEVWAFSKAGDQLSKVSSVTQIPGGNRVWINVNSSFPGLSNLIGWVQVGSNRQLDVFAELQASDVSSSYRASEGLSSQLFVPHVAKNTSQFETIISTINGGSAEAGADITPEPFGDAYAFDDLDCGYTQTSGNAVDYFGADLIEIVDWASIESPMSSVAAMEYFSYLPDRSRVASLGLTESTTDHLRFLHVAADVSQFWTGLVYMNVGNGTESVTERYFDASGNVLKEEQVSLIRGQKRTLLFDADNTEPAGTVWVDVQAATPNLVGYELFGSANGTPHRFFAGLQGSSTEGRTLVFPHVRTTGGEWTGLVALNVGGVAANITFEAMSDSGSVIESQTVTGVAPNGKFVQTTDGLFAASTLSQVTWVRATTSGSSWAGFELWGDLGETRHKLSGIVATVTP